MVEVSTIRPNVENQHKAAQAMIKEIKAQLKKLDSWSVENYVDKSSGFQVPISRIEAAMREFESKQWEA